jgi:ribosomal protein S27AE
MEAIMARALTEKTKNEQLGSHTVSSALSHKSMCARCGGLMVQDYCLDVLGNIGESEFAAKRCVQCGEVVDSIILRNRATRHEAMMAPPARVLSI